MLREQKNGGRKTKRIKSETLNLKSYGPISTIFRRETEYLESHILESFIPVSKLVLDLYSVNCRNQ